MDEDFAHDKSLLMQSPFNELPIRAVRKIHSEPSLTLRPEKASSIERDRRRSAPARNLPESSDFFDVREEGFRQPSSAGNINAMSTNIGDSEVNALSCDLNTKLRSTSEAPQPRSTPTSTSFPVKRAKINDETDVSSTISVDIGPAFSLLGRSRRDSAIGRAAILGQATTPGSGSAVPVPSPRTPYFDEQSSVDDSFATNSSQSRAPVSTGKILTQTSSKSKRQYKRKRSTPSSKADLAFRPSPSRAVRATPSTRRQSRLSKSVDESTDSSTAANVSEPYEGCSVGFAASGCTRPTGRTRPGRFEEDQLVAGMRFIVI
jgi:hypothetical protein